MPLQVGNAVVDLRGDHHPERAKKKKETEEKRAETSGSFRILHLASRGRDGKTALRLLFDPLVRPPHRGLHCRLQELSGAAAASVLGGGPVQILSRCQRDGGVVGRPSASPARI
jgi:hypothetical protein